MLILGSGRAKKGPRCDQEGHQEPQKPKILHLQKPYKTICLSRAFWVQRLLRRVLVRKPKKAPGMHPKNSKASKRRFPKVHHKITIRCNKFGAILGSTSVPKVVKQGVYRYGQLWNHPAPPFRGPEATILRTQ